MLNPPLSLLSDDLLVSIVEQLAKLPFSDDDLNNLSLTDRAFTQSCQKYTFQKLVLGNGRNVSRQLKKVNKFLNNKPSFANRVRMVQLHISRQENASLFKNANFTSILQLFAKSPMPPHEFHLSGLLSAFAIIQDPMHTTAWGIILFTNLDYSPFQRNRERSIASYPHLPQVERGDPRPSRSY